MLHRGLLRRVLTFCLVLALILPLAPVKAAENEAVWKSSATASDAVYYTKLSDAIAKANTSGGYVKMLKDVHYALSGSYAITVKREFTLDLGGHTLSSSNYLFQVFRKLTDATYNALPDAQKVFKIQNGTLYTDVDENGSRKVKTDTDTNAHTSFLVNIFRGYLQMENVNGHAVGQAISFYSPYAEDPAKGLVNTFKSCTLVAERWYTFVYNSAGGGTATNEKPTQKDMNVTVEDCTFVSLNSPIFGTRQAGNTVTLLGANKFYCPRSSIWIAPRGNSSKVDVFSGGTARYIGMTADDVSFKMPGKYADKISTFSSLRQFETERIAAPGAVPEALQRAVAETAIAYYNRGTQGQYDSTSLMVNGSSYSGSRRTSGAAPEVGAPDSLFYTVCSDFIYNVYKNALDYEFMGTPTHSITNYMTRDIHKNNPMVLRKYSAAAGDDKAAFLADMQANFESLMQPGDVVVQYRTGSSSGHAMLYVGDIDGDGKGDLLHSGGDHFNLIGSDYKASLPDGYERFEDENTSRTKNGTVMLDSAYDYLVNPANTNGSYYYHHFGKTPIDEIILLRPLLDASCPRELTPSASIRLSHPGLVVTRTADVTRYNSVLTGQDVTVTVTVENRNNKLGFSQGKNTDYDALTLTEFLPAGAKLVKADGALQQGSALIFTAAPKAGTTVTLSYTVRITAAAGSRVTFPLSCLSDGKGNLLPTRSFYFRVGTEHFDGSKLLANAVQYETDNSAAVDKILGKQLKLPINDIAALQEGLFDRVAAAGLGTVNYPDQQMWRLKDRKDVSSPYLPLYDMLVDEHDAGFMVYTGNDPTVKILNPSIRHRVREFREEYYEPGDIFIGYARQSAFDVKNSEQLAVIKA